MVKYPEHCNFLFRHQQVYQLFRKFYLQFLQMLQQQLRRLLPENLDQARYLNTVFLGFFVLFCLFVFFFAGVVIFD